MIETYLIVSDNKVNKMLQECCQREWWQLLIAQFVYSPLHGQTICVTLVRSVTRLGQLGGDALAELKRIPDSNKAGVCT